MGKATKKKKYENVPKRVSAMVEGKKSGSYLCENEGRGKGGGKGGGRWEGPHREGPTYNMQNGHGW